MKNSLELFLLILLFCGLYSCTPSAPYEITSPCVVGDSDNPYSISPCERVPLNIGHVVTWKAGFYSPIGT